MGLFKREGFPERVIFFFKIFEFISIYFSTIKKIFLSFVLCALIIDVSPLFPLIKPASLLFFFLNIFIGV